MKALRDLLFAVWLELTRDRGPRILAARFEGPTKRAAILHWGPAHEPSDRPVRAGVRAGRRSGLSRLDIAAGSWLFVLAMVGFAALASRVGLAIIGMMVAVMVVAGLTVAALEHFRSDDE